MKRVLVIVVTHNGMHWLQRCLDSVYADADLYVWDNDSVDGSADFVTARYPAAKLIRSAENLGFSMPNNEGMKWALSHGYDYAYLLNQDAWLEAGALDKLVAAADAHPDFGLLSPLQMTDGYAGLDRQFAKALKRGGRHALDQVQPMFGPGPISGAGPGPVSVPPSGLQGISGGPGPGGKMGPRPNDAWTRSKGCDAGTKSGQSVPGGAENGDAGTKRVVSVPVPRVMAAHWLIPTGVIKRIGLFNEELFPLWGQDDDWCARLDFCGLKIGVVPEARAVHDRAYRKEEKETLVRRNYYTGSLVRLCDCRRPLWVKFLYVIPFTLVKALKYRSWLSFKYFRTILDLLPKVKEHRQNVRART